LDCFLWAKRESISSSPPPLEDDDDDFLFFILLLLFMSLVLEEVDCWRDFPSLNGFDFFGVLLSFPSSIFAFVFGGFAPLLDSSRCRFAMASISSSEIDIFQ